MPRPSHPGRRTRPAIEALEDRKLLYSTLGAGWGAGARVTFSLAPDGTNIGGVPSALFSSLSGRGIAAAQVKEAFQKAAAVWAATAHLDLVLVGDDGTAFGAPGMAQGDARFGDVRIGGASLASNVLATAFLPPPINGGTIAGDLVFNTSQAWRINKDYDLQTVAIHELGHALGLGHASATSSAMFATYTGMKQALAADDAAGIQAVYGPRPADAFDAVAPNGTYATATDLDVYLDPDDQIRLGDLDLTTSGDMDWYAVTAPATSTGSLTVTVQAAGLSLLSPRVTIFNASLQSLATASAPNSYGGTVTATISGVAPGQTFYVRASAASSGATAIGTYGLLMNFGSSPMAPLASPVGMMASTSGSGSAATSMSEEVAHEEMVRVGALEAFGHELEIAPIGRARAARAAIDFPRGSDAPDWAPFVPPAAIEAPKAPRAARVRATDAAIAAWIGR